MLLIAAKYKSTLERAFHEKKAILMEVVAEKTKSITKPILRAVATRLFAQGKLRNHAPGKSSAPLPRTLDSIAGLAPMVSMRGVNQKPFISLDDCMSPSPLQSLRNIHADFVDSDYLTILGAFHQLQTTPGFGKRLEGYGIDYMKYAHFTVPRHHSISMKAKLQEALDPDSLIYWSPGEIYQHSTASPVTTGIRAGDLKRSFTQSTLATLVDTPISDYSFFGNDSSSPSTSVILSGKRSYGDSKLFDDPETLGSIRSHLSSAKSRSSSMDTACESFNLPLPPIGVLLAWHAHLMRPDLYDLGTQSVYKNLTGVPFPLHEAVGPFILK